MRTVPFRLEDGTLDADAYAAALRPGRTKLVALGHASNALGTVTDVADGGLVLLADEYLTLEREDARTFGKSSGVARPFYVAVRDAAAVQTVTGV